MEKSKKVVFTSKQQHTTNTKNVLPVHFEPAENDYASLEKDLQEMERTVKRIREKYYSTNVALDRIQSRTLREIYRAKIWQLTEQLKKNKTEHLKWEL